MSLTERFLARCTPRLTPHLVALSLSLLWLAFVAATLSDYGVTSDSPSLFYSGDRHLFWLTHPFTPGALDFTGAEPAAFHSKFFRFPETSDPLHYPVFPGLCAALVAALTSSATGWLSAIDGHQLGLGLLQAANLYVFARYAMSLFGLAAGASGALMLACFPTIAGHALNNAKDLPCILLYGSALLAGARGVLRRSPRDLLACGLLTGLGLSCKLNAVFALVTLLLWTPLAYLARLRREPASRRDWLRVGLAAYGRPLALLLLVGFYRPLGAVIAASALLVEPLLLDVLAGRSTLSRRWLLAYAAIPAVAVVTFVVLWPWLWAGQGLTFAGRLAEYVNFMIGFGSSTRETFTSYPFRCLLFTTPPLVLLLAGLGAVGAFGAGRGDRRGDGGLLLALLGLWLAVPLVRIAVPRSMFYDANRHFLEYVPPLCLLAGLGFEAAVAALRRFVRPALATLGLLAAVGCALALPLVSYHPYEVAYFNWLAGGLGGAQQSALLWVPHEDWRSPGTEGDYWHSSLRDFLRHVGPGQIVPATSLIGTCGTSYQQAAANGADLRFASPDDSGEYLYIGPREHFCGWGKVRALESQRPVLYRVMRGGGLIYEILGPKVDYALPTLSPATGYAPAGTLFGEWLLLPPGGRSLDDFTQVDDRHVELSDTGAAWGLVDVPTDSSALILRARGDDCEGPPELALSIDGELRATLPVTSGKWTDYPVVTETAAGQHRVTVAFTNDRCKPPGCDRNLYFASLRFKPKVARPAR